MIQKILIANRGEIACRVARTAQRMGIACVAVYSDADKGALHTRVADEAVRIGPAAAAESYLNIPAILAAAAATGADAIHPGYGFLSENPDFVDAVAAAGLTFIGPSSEAIRAMGLKDAAKRRMEAAGVPVVPGYHGADQSPEHLADAADGIGYPVMIKAVAGGGGKGMRIVDAPDAFASALASAQSEARAAFGNDAVLVEKFVAQPRHIEIQVFGDGDRAIHLFERDCSLQRRHQKVLEEAPAPGMTEEMRAAMGAAAVRAAEAIGYKGAGTVEFIADASEGLRADRFYFMEMNTRLQVEHPVTELITGLDLVELQIRLAAGQGLQVAQEDVQIQGAAIEARVYAENPANGFLPETGRLAHVAFPSDARVDTGVETGDTISPWYDPMIAKVIVHADTRAAALQKLSRALQGTEIAGVVTNVAFLDRLCGHETFVQGDMDTGLIDRELDALTRPPADAPLAAVAAAQAAMELTEPTWDQGFALWAPLQHAVTLQTAGEDIAVRSLEASPSRQIWQVTDTALTLSYQRGAWVTEAGQALPKVFMDGRDYWVLGNEGAKFTHLDPLAVDDASAAQGSAILAPMPGRVKRIFAKPGDAVAIGDPLAVLEAMKMEHTLTAPRDAQIEEVLVADEAQVAAGDLLIRLDEPADA